MKIFLALLMGLTWAVTLSTNINAANTRLETAKYFYENTLPELIKTQVHDGLENIARALRDNRVRFSQEAQRIIVRYTDESDTYDNLMSVANDFLAMPPSLEQHRDLIKQTTKIEDSYFQRRGLIEYVRDYQQALQDDRLNKTQASFCQDLAEAIQTIEVNYPSVAPVGSRVGPFVPPPDVSNKKQDEQYMALGGALGEGANGYANQFTVGTIAGTAIGAVGGIVGSIIGAVVGAAVSAVSIGIGWVVSKIKTWFENRRRRKAAEQAYREAVDRDRHAQEKDIAETLAFMKQHPVNGQLLTTHARQTCEATSIFDQTIKLEIDLTQAEIVKWGNLYQDNLAKLAEDRRKLEEWQLAVKNYGERVIQTVLNAIEQQAMQAKERRNRILRFMALFAKNIVPYEQKISSCLSPLFSYEERELCMSEMMDRANLEIEELEKQVLEAEQHDEPHIVRTKNSFFIFVANCQERLQESGTWIE